MSEESQQNVQNGESSQQPDWQALAEERLSGWKRALADYENLRRDNERQQERTVSMARLRFALDFLNFFDNFLMALEHIPADIRTSPWAVGLDHVKRQAEEVIKGLGLTPMNVTVGMNFDHLKHEAIETITEDSLTDQQIAKVISDGYTLGDELVRPARVVVNSKK